MNIQELNDAFEGVEVISVEFSENSDVRFNVRLNGCDGWVDLCPRDCGLYVEAKSWDVSRTYSFSMPNQEEK